MNKFFVFLLLTTSICFAGEIKTQTSSDKNVSDEKKDGDKEKDVDKKNSPKDLKDSPKKDAVANKDKKEDPKASEKKEEPKPLEEKSIFESLKKEKPVTVFESNNAGTETIIHALESTYQTNTELKEQTQKLREADESIVQAKAGYRPHIGSAISLGSSKSIDGGGLISQGIDTTEEMKTISNLRGEVSVEQNIFKGGLTLAQVKSAKAQIKVARFQLLSKEQDVFSQAIKAFLDILTKEAEIESYKSNVEYLKSSLHATKAKYDVGEETRTSVAQAEAQLAEGEAQLDVAKAELESLKADYKRITGKDAKSLAKPIQIFSLLPKTLEKANQTAIENHPSILAAKYEEEMATHNIDVETSGLLPSLDLKASAMREQSRNKGHYSSYVERYNLLDTTRDTKTNYDARLTLTVPIYEQGTIRSKVRQAHEVRAEKKIAIETIRKAIIAKIAEAWHNYLAAKANMESYAKQVEACTVSLDGTLEEMRVSTKILLDVLNAQKALLQARLNFVRAERTFYLSGFTVLSYMGMLTARNLKLNVPYYDANAHYREVKNKF